MSNRDLDDVGLRSYLGALAHEVDAGVPERPAAGAPSATRRPWLVPVGIAAAVVLLAVGMLTRLQDDPASVDTSGDPAPSTTQPSTESDGNESSLEVVPSDGLADGAIVELRISRPDLLVGTDIAVCTGDALDGDLYRACDVGAVVSVDGDRATPPVAEDGLRVSVSRVIQVTQGSSDPNVPLAYDCATEPAGCMLAIGDRLVPDIHVSAPLGFAPGPRGEPELTLEPSVGLSEGDEVTVTGRGLRPNGLISLDQCSADLDVDMNCGGEFREVRTDEAGQFSTRIAVTTSLYGYQGRTDCVATPCTIRVVTGEVDAPQTGPISFAPGTVAPVPSLSITPSGPYADQQVVTVRGTGFPPGRDLGGDLAQCPAHLDTRVEERCVYNAALIGEFLVAADGTFETDVTLYESLNQTGTCVGPPGCVLAWVIQNGPIVASVPLDFDA